MGEASERKRVIVIPKGYVIGLTGPLPMAVGVALIAAGLFQGKPPGVDDWTPTIAVWGMAIFGISLFWFLILLFLCAGTGKDEWHVCLPRRGGPPR